MNRHAKKKEKKVVHHLIIALEFKCQCYDQSFELYSTAQEITCCTCKCIGIQTHLVAVHAVAMFQGKDLGERDAH